MCRLGCSVLPQSRNIASKLGDRDDRTTDPQKNYRPINDIIPSFFVFNGNFNGEGNGPIFNIMSENDLNMINLVI